jgi:hypothetical protein
MLAMRLPSTRVWSALLPSLAALALLGFATRTAQAQTAVPTASNLAARSGQSLAPEQVNKPERLPDALPGASSQSDRVTPAQHAPIANPTDALFDAINRGDIATARDAIDRGADLSGRNILGLTPLDLSVDLGRNDITFLLLSLRNGDSKPNRGGPARTVQTAKTEKPSPGKTATDPKVAARAPAKPARPVVAVADPVPQPVAQQFASGGTPDPAVGFLGFGPVR